MTANLTRRRLLQAGGLGLMGLSLPRLLRAEAEPAPLLEKPRADACIIIFLNGGPSHLDMWDLKPEAPAGIRGEFQPIATSLPGVRFCEHLPRLARHMHRAALVRSMHHTVNNSHALAVYTAMTGHDRGDVNVIIGNGSSDSPTPGAALSLIRPPRTNVVPHVVLPYITKEGAGGPPQPGFFGGFLGRAHDPLFVLKDPNAASFSVPELTLQVDVSQSRLAGRRELLADFERQFSGHARHSSVAALDQFQQRAVELLTSPAAQRAFRIGDETAAARDSYGRNIYGQSVLLARRLIEAGTRLVTISWAPDANATWDTHGGNFKKLRGTLLPQFDAACASLIADLAERGMLERTLVAVMGDFGRSPKVNNNDGGRDHWNYCYSVLLVGGGVRPGLVYGASDKTGAFPADKPVTPGDLVSTVYHALGVRHDAVLHDLTGRPQRLIPKGEVVAELLI